MRIEKIENVKVFTIYDAPGLDPVTVFMQDVKQSHGRLIIECYGESWSAYWGGMGDRKLIEFLLSCNAGYIIGKMETKRMLKRDMAYLKRIVEAVLEALPDYEQPTTGQRPIRRKENMEDLKLFVERRDKALLSLDKDELTKLFSETLTEVPSDDRIFWAGVHMARLQVESFSDSVKAESLGWLHANGHAV